MIKKPLNPQQKTARLLMVIAALLSVGPFVIGIIGMSLIPGCNASNCEWAVFPVYSILFFPISLTLFIVGVVKNDKAKYPRNPKP